MTMTQVCDVSKIVTAFLLNTCRLRRSKRDIDALVCCVDVAKRDLMNDEEAETIPLITGSVAEFYIEPMLPYVGDIDMMFHVSTELAIPRGHPPPTQLPAEFHNRVKVFEIIDSHLPGYVYLELRCLLTECSDDGNYNAEEYDRDCIMCTRYLVNQLYYTTLDVHGPAAYFPARDTRFLSADYVPCVRCLSWPPQAAAWPTRYRNYGWPDSATLDRVVSNGCDVVPVAHRQCRQHVLIGVFQQRLSFSRAEIVLMNSWMPVQQIVYHMLRYFIKTERLTDCADNSGAGTLSNYHIKTLMLWACELKSRSWWADDVNLVRMCVQLLHVLANWLTEAQCQHYFINNCNLIDNSLNVTNTEDQLMSIDETWLSTWFVDNYIRKCSEFTPYNILRLFDDVSTSMKLQYAVSTLVAWRINNSVVDLWGVFERAELDIPSIIYYHSLTARSCVCFVTELTKIDSRLFVYFTAVAFLYVAYKSQRHGLNDELMDVLTTVLCGQSTTTRRYPYHSTSVLSLNIAAKLMKVVANKSLSTMSLIEIELSKAYLYRALRCKDSDSDSIYCLANVYLAVLYYTTGQYQTAVDHCTLVTSSQDHLQCSSHVVQGEILPKVDDDIDNVLGLAVFYQHVRTATLNQKRQGQHVIVFTTELFAYYLHIKYILCLIRHCRQFMQMSLTDEFKWYRICITDTPQLFIGDLLLFLSVSRLLRFPHKPICSKSQPRVTNADICNTSESDHCARLWFCTQDCRNRL